MPAKKEVDKSKGQVTIPAIRKKRVKLHIVGDSPLICNRFSDVAKQTIEDKQTGKATQGRKVKNPEADFKNSLYEMSPGKYGFPCSGFKKCAVRACSSLKGSITQTVAKQSHHVLGTLVEIKGSKPRKRGDIVRIGGRSADIHFRGEFPKWECYLDIVYNEAVISLEQLVNLYNVAGFGVGVGDWRPEKSGSHGMFHVE